MNAARSALTAKLVMPPDRIHRLTPELSHGLPPPFELDTKVAYAVNANYKVGFESYNVIGPVHPPGYLEQQSQTLYAVVDTDIKGWDLNLGLGHGLTSISDQVILKAIVGVPFY